MIIQTNHFQWQQLESEDYRTYISRLRSIGCPEQTIRDIVIADVEKMMAPRVAATIPRRPELRYWDPEEEELWHGLDHRVAQKQQWEIEQEKREVILELIGADLVGERMNQTGESDYYSRRMGFLPEEKRARLRHILEDYDQAQTAFREKELEESEALSPADREEMFALLRKQKEQVAALLTPAEKEQYDLWLSPTATQIRHAIYGMGASEEEFLALYRLRQPFDERWPWAEPGNPEWQKASRELEASLRQRLGESRYAAYQRGQDPDYRGMTRTVARFRLAKNTADYLYDFKQTVAVQRQELLKDESLTDTQKEMAVTALSKEAQTIAQESLGEKGYRYYLQQGQSGWLK